MKKKRDQPTFLTHGQEIWLKILLGLVLLTGAISLVPDFFTNEKAEFDYWYVLFMIFTSVTFVFMGSIIAYNSWNEPKKFSEAAQYSANRIKRYPLYKYITITNKKFLLWWWRFISPIIVVLGLLGLLLAKSLFDYLRAGI